MDIVNDEETKIVVLSANGKTTDDFEALAGLLLKKEYGKAVVIKGKLTYYYLSLVDELFASDSHNILARQFIHTVFQQIQSRIDGDFAGWDADWLIGRGEIISTALFSILLNENNIKHRMMWAQEIMFKNDSGQADTTIIKENFNSFLDANQTANLIITQGFICTNHLGLPDTFGRGGSDYSASLLGQACLASTIKIWSDVDGFLNNDPNFVRGSLPLQNLSFDEAAELAYFGARILHPASIIPAKQAGIPVLLKNTLNPNARGTLISDVIQKGGIKAVAAKDGITAITIHSDRMLLAYGFLRNIFEVFEKYKTPVDMVTTSEVSVSVTIDNVTFLENILAELAVLGELEFNQNQSIVCIVGDHFTENQGQVAQMFLALKNIPIRMISYGAAKNSISFLVDTSNRTQTLESLNALLPKSQERTHQYV
jgi:aspartate kinase